MSHSVKMPPLGEGITEGTVTRWLKAVGDLIEVGEPLVEVSTDKVDTEIPALIAGVLERIIVSEDQVIQVGAELGSITTTPTGSPPPAGTTAVAPTSAPTQAPPADAGVAGEQLTANAGTVITLPAMGESVTEGTVTRWLKRVGDTVKVDEPLVEVSTDKVDTEIPSPIAGTVLELTVEEDQTVPIGSRLALIGAPKSASPPAGQSKAVDNTASQSEQAPQALQPVQSTAPTSQHPSAAPMTASLQQPPPTNAVSLTAGTYVTPVIRKLAADKQVDLASIKGSGVGGRIRREDVVAAGHAQREVAEQAAATVVPAAPDSVDTSVSGPEQISTVVNGTTQKLTRIRQSIAKNMLYGLQTAAQLTTVIEVDVTRVAHLRATVGADFHLRQGVKLTYLPFFVKAAAEATKLHPVVNSSLSDDHKEITYHSKVHLGIAVDTPRGLIVPVIKNADDLDLIGIAHQIDDLANRTRNNQISPADLSGGTFTITNTGSVGALFDTPIFVPPQSAILATGAVVRRPVVMSDADGVDVIAIRSMTYLALSYDHRSIDGADASRFLQAVKRRIEQGAFKGDLGL